MTNHRSLLTHGPQGAVPIAAALVALAACLPAAAERLEFSFTNSYDGSEQLATALVPEACLERDDNPLLVLAHHAGGDRFSQSYFDAEIEARQWLLVIPDLHGRGGSEGQYCWAPLEAQHDLVDAVAYMRQHYGVDSTRIYIAGRSMGGTLSAMTAAKYPDLFAAAVPGQGVYDWRARAGRELSIELSPEAEASRAEMVSRLSAEFGGPYTGANQWAYERQSAVNYAPNLAYVPIVLWHGTMDEVVLPEQASLLTAAIRRHDPYQPEPHWLRGAPHAPMNFPPEWILDQLKYYRNVGDWGWGKRFYPEMELVTDEAKDFFWIHITPSAADEFARVKVSVTGGALTVQSQQTAAVQVRLDRIPPQVRFAAWTVEAGGELALSVTRGDTILFESRVSGKGAGELPDFWLPSPVAWPREYE